MTVALEEDTYRQFRQPEGVTPLATFWRQATEGTFYWRLLIPARHLPGQVNDLRNSDIAHPDPLARQAGVAVWQFLGDLERTRFAARLQSAGVKSMMELDDNYMLPPPPVPGVKSGWSRTIKDSWKKGATGYSHQAHKLILPSLDGLIVSTDELAERYAPRVPAGVFVCPNSVDPDDWDPVEPRETTRVGFAGSASHQYDLHIVDRALDWASRHTSLVKLGASTSNWRWPHEQMPWTDDLAEYRRNLQMVDIGLCPLKRSDWHDCKSDIKAMEYLMAGAVPVVQADSPVFKDWLDLVPSASTPKQWERTVKELVLMPADDRHRIWRDAHAFLMEHKTIHTHIHKWRRAIG